MQINSVSTSVPVTFTKPASSLAGATPAGDQVAMSTSANTYFSYLGQVSQIPEVRDEMVDAYKARIQAGYPASEDLEKLVNLMGATWTKSPDPGDSSK